MKSTPICRFYDGANILVTGGTGFMGKILIEKLLRSTGIRTLYLLVREKKGKTINSRLDDMFNNVVFDVLRKEKPKFRDRVVAIGGDCTMAGLGLTLMDKQKLISEINVVFHVAATVRFDENLKLSYSINVNGTSDVLELCHHMKNLKSLVHVSTAYSNCHLDTIDESFYDYPINYEQVGTLLEKISEEEADQLTPSIIGKWPNTYTFTKALAEALIRNKSTGLPVGIFRPAIVISTYKEPIEGWIDNMYGPTGACAGAASGLLRVLHCDKNVNADVVPVDTCVAGIIAAAWDISIKNKTRKPNNAPIYNYVSSVENRITWEEYNTLNKVYGHKYPFNDSIWSIKFETIASPYLYFFLKLLLHFVPALIMDAATMVTGQKPRLITMYTKVHKFSDVISFFCTREWTFRNDNIRSLWNKMENEDKAIFPLSIAAVPWLTYFRNYFKGIRVYLMRDPIDTLHQAQIRKRRFDIAHHVIICFLYFFATSLVWVIFRNIISHCTSTYVTAYYKTLLKNDTCDFLT